MHGDEPDNAQSLGQGNGYGPPIPPERIIADYHRVRMADPSRPVLLNLGQGSEMLAAVTALNQQIVELAPVLNSPTIRDAARVQSENSDVPIAMMVKQQKGATYLFAVGMRDGVTTATFTLGGIKGEKMIEVLGENRTVVANNGSFSDRFGPWDVHLYRLSAM
jgi:hypothetical protein